MVTTDLLTRFSIKCGNVRVFRDSESLFVSNCVFISRIIYVPERIRQRVLWSLSKRLGFVPFGNEKKKIIPGKKRLLIEVPSRTKASKPTNSGCQWRLIRTK